MIHWKMAYTLVLDETIHQSGVKVGVGTPICCKISGFQETWETKKKIVVSWVFTFTAHTLPATDWFVVLIGPHVSFT
jgi:hypothetical protein